MSDNISVFDKYADTTTAPTRDNPKTPYQAVERSADQEVKRIRIHHGNGKIEITRYSDLSTMISIAPDRLGLLFPTGAIFMQGDNLRQLLDDFQDERVRAIYAFRSDVHEEPEEGAVVIYRMEWRTNEQIQEASQ